MPSNNQVPIDNLLQAARDLIADKSRWCQGRYASDNITNKTVSPTDPTATHWCARGAVRRVTTKYANKCLEYLARAAATNTGNTHTTIEVNDQLGHAATLAMFDTAIQLAKGERND